MGKDEDADSNGNLAENLMKKKTITTEDNLSEKIPSDDVKPVGTEADSDDDSEQEQQDSDYESSDSEEDSGPDLARGEGNVESSSESEDEVYQDGRAGPKVDHDWNELDKDAERSEDISRRLAVCNMDWDRIKAQDLFVLFHSFKPQMGKVIGVTIYPSEFGKQRMAEEDQKGPTEFIQNEVQPTDEVTKNSEDVENGGRYNAEKLRQYQIKRLKYYYAVVECDSAETANAIYEECDGMEFETSSARFDIRFIPDDVTFKEDEPKEKCDTLPEKDAYQPCSFVTTALNQAKVDLTWDETDRSRLNVTTKKFTDAELADMDMKDFLASSSSEEEEEDDDEDQNGCNGDLGLASKMSKADQIDMYRSLLLGDLDNKKDKEEKDVHMEVSWNPDNIKNDDADDTDSSDDDGEEDEETKRLMKEINGQPEEGEEDDEGSTADDEGESEDEKDNSEEKEKELQLLMMEEKDANKNHFDMKEILKSQENKDNSKKRKGRKNYKKKSEEDETKDDFEIDLDDTRFKALYSSSEFALDPNNPAFKKSKGMQELLKEGQKRRNTTDYQSADDKKKAKLDQEDAGSNPTSGATDISKLIKSVKAKTKQRFSNKKKPLS